MDDPSSEDEVPIGEPLDAFQTQPILSYKQRISRPLAPILSYTQRKPMLRYSAIRSEKPTYADAQLSVRVILLGHPGLPDLPARAPDAGGDGLVSSASGEEARS